MELDNVLFIPWTKFQKTIIKTAQVDLSVFVYQPKFVTKDYSKQCKYLKFQFWDDCLMIMACSYLNEVINCLQEMFLQEAILVAVIISLQCFPMVIMLPMLPFVFKTGTY